MIEDSGRSHPSDGRATGLRPQPAAPSSQSSVPNAVLLALADRAEQATGPDRELDRAIELAIYPDRVTPPVGLPLLEYTASIDAAMTLLPEGCELVTIVAINRPGFLPSAGVNGGQHISHAVTPALALTAAALRARAASAMSAQRAETAKQAQGRSPASAVPKGDAQ